MIHFHKYHGAGNDFILTENPLAAQYASLLCHRQQGIGADGVLFLEPSDIADIKMRIFNSDGSEANCCGNGLRCVVKHLKRSVTIESLAGLSLGVYTPSAISITFPKTLILKKLDVGYLIDTGVPHLVLFNADFFKNAKKYRLDMNVNVSLVLKIGDAISIRTYERGVEGETLACGTGGAAAALSLRDMNPNEDSFKVTFASGETALYSFDSKGRLWMKGIIKYLFEGNYKYENEDWCSKRN